ncbi:hypothetical protein JRG66_08755 [Salinimicrobium tongyeongense]|uniref:Uncharacterized protein n=1 Tax=Salinimicrobium tongyeongense TaxID=2809707 RepID=A0ABY6NNF2_9FLAO|nr:hypothetical protein [Salinimicrobium tongyeongense]UZH54093.1 hypothetical protein JRG66_08755 [Salinimicrobium tongyeongense]
MRNKFFELSSKQKRRFYIKLISIVLSLLIPIFFISFYFKIYFLAPITFWIVLSVIASFFDMPSMIKNGKLQYESSLLISEKEKDHQITIHGGTLFDYYFVLNKDDNGKNRRNFILSEYLNGILNLVASNNEKPNLEITGTTYILNPRTANKIGFEVQKTKPAQLIILILNYPNLVFTRSFANKKLSFPNLKNIKTYKSNIQKLEENKQRISKIRNALQSRIAKNV